MIQNIIPFIVTARPWILSLAGETINSTQVSPTDAYARIRVADDGYVYKSEDTGSASWSIIDGSTDWILPRTFAPGTFEVRYTNFTGDALASATVSEDTWHPLSSGDFVLVLSEVGLDSKTCSFDIEVRWGDSGNADETGSYTLEVDTGSP